MAAKLTKRIVDAAKPKASEYFIWDAGDGSLKGFGLRVWPSGKKTYVAQFRIGGGRGAKSRRVTIAAWGGGWTVEQARAEAERLIREADKGIDEKALQEAAEAAHRAAQEAAEAEQRRAAEMRLSVLAERFMSEHVALKRKGTTEAFYRIVLDRHILPALGDKDARHITRQDVARMHARLADKATMANRAVAVLGAIYGWAERLEILPEGTRNPTTKIEKFREQGRERYLTVEELARLGEAIRIAETVGIEWAPREGANAKHAPKAEHRRVVIAPETAAALRLLIFTGARLREILHLEWSAVDVERGLLRLRDSKTGPKVIVLNAPARAVLVGLPRVGRYVIPGDISTGPDGRTIEKPRADLKRPWALVCKAAGLSGLRIHDLRHSFASVGAGEGHGLAIVGKLLGHAQARTTQRYAHLDNDPLRKASDAIASRIAAAMGEAQRESTAEVIEIAKGRIGR
ncbi:site-specific integrase [Starkeya koreensis]|uniref:Site-specific integrase n=1 Tax=Ancylobacter koreensis TaxID=266121 RepID=A0ABT0DHT3_9HYPH|nr:site-specific integrase [Ancylobacter koreensis]MCK0206840.1 site-specific integrase [Ancylobacter koreensis]